MGHRCLLSTWKRSIDWTIQQIMAIKIADRIVKHAPKKNRPYIDFINQSKPWHQPVTQPKQATNHESIHPKPQQKRVSHGFFLIQIHPVTTWRSASLPNNLRCDMTFNSWITLMVSLAPGPRLFLKRVPAVYWDPQVGSNSFQLEIDGQPLTAVVFFSKTHIGFCQAILGSN